MSVLDMDERLIDIALAVDITASPVTDIKEIPEVDVGIVEGAVSNEHNLEVLETLRSRCKILVALGDCAGFGCIPMLRNALPLRQVLEHGYIWTRSTAGGIVPDDPEVPRLMDQVHPLRDFVKVDVHLPGCPPSADVIFHALAELAAGRIPEIPQELLKYD
jgi:NAD-reducing hydrogenase small subunit